MKCEIRMHPFLANFCSLVCSKGVLEKTSKFMLCIRICCNKSSTLRVIHEIMKYFYMHYIWTVSSMINFDQVFQSTISFRSFSMHLLTCMNSGNLLTGVLYIESFSKLKFSSQFKNCTKNEIQICDKIPGNFAALLQTWNSHQILGINLVCTKSLYI